MRKRLKWFVSSEGFQAKVVAWLELTPREPLLGFTGMFAVSCTPE